MKAVITHPGTKGSAAFGEVEKPAPLLDQVLVRVLRVGIDGTDLDIDAGRYGAPPAGADFLIVGHEAIGRIETAGPGAKSFQKGELVVATVRRPDDCVNCTAGQSDMCLKGNYVERGIKGAHGYMAEYYAEYPDWLIRIPENLFPVAVMLEPLSVAEKGIQQAYEAQKRMVWEPSTALVFGAGTLGLLAMLLLRNRGLRTYVAARDPQTSGRVALVRQTGAEYICTQDVPISNLPEKIGKIDLIVEATGASQVAFDAMQILGRNGVLVLLGVYGEGAQMEIPAGEIGFQMVMGNKLTVGSVNSNPRHFETALQHMIDIEQKWPGLLARYITRKLPLERFREGFNRQHEDIKVMLEVAES